MSTGRRYRRTRSSGATPAEMAPEGSVSELARWVERPTRIEIAPAARPQLAGAMRVLVTGAAGFLGRALVEALRAGHDVIATDRADGDIADRGAPRPPLRRSRSTASSISPRSSAVPPRPTSSRPARQPRGHARVCSIAAAPRHCEAARSCASSTRARSRCSARRCRRASTTPPRRRRRLSYGTHKRVAELLIDDATRRGELDGRSLRLSGVVVRPPLPNGALSAFNSDLIREPLAGRDYECPVGADATIWLTSRRADGRQPAAPRRGDGAAIGAQRARHRAGAGDLDRRDRRRARPRRRRRAGARPLSPAGRRSRRSSAAGRSTARSPGESLGLAGEASIDTLIRDHLESTA